MITEHTVLQMNQTVFLPEGYQPEEVLFFDIETTGFAADVTVLYLIGCVFYKDGMWQMLQWFADDSKSEKGIIETFFPFLSGFRLLIHYNGTGFDLPYLLKKCTQFGLPYNFCSINGLDMYRKILPFKKLFKMENLKQKTVELYLGTTREDKFTGGEIIKYYGAYLKARYAHLPEEKEYYSLLTLHNRDDLKGLLSLSPMLAYPAILERELTLAASGFDLEKEEFFITFSLPLTLPKRISYGNSDVYFSASGSAGTLRIALYRGELKYFYSNYKDYYYLPAEDSAVHKSVAFYVDKDFRTRARAATCYSRRTGCFLPQYAEVIEPYFKIDYYDKTTYIEPTEDFRRDTKSLVTYGTHLLRHLLLD